MLQPKESAGIVPVWFYQIHQDVFVDMYIFLTSIEDYTLLSYHYSDIIMGTVASQITSLAIVYSTA